MTEKIVLSIYNALSIIIWSAVIGLIVFAIVLFCVGEKQEPQFTAEAISVQQALPDDENLAQKNESSNNWYVISYNMSVTGATLSPFTYTANDIALYTPKELRYDNNCFTVLSEPVVYSKTQPCEFVVLLYVKSNADISQIAQTAKTAGFGLREVTQSFSFFKKELQMELPHFSLESSPDIIPAY